LRPYLVPFQPGSNPPKLVIDGAGARDRLSFSGEIVELAGLDCLADETLGQGLESVSAMGLHEPRLIPGERAPKGVARRD